MQDLKISESEYEKCQDVLKLKYQMLEKARADVEELKTQLSSMEIKMHNDLVTNSNEKAKLKMRLRTTQAKLDAFKGRYKETMKEACFMNKKYEEGSGKLKEQLASYGVEVLHLKKKLAAMKG
ncbi:hypothetical protein GIB67_024171 [Kingdonia uniflora]|uniref:Uncharacterized protein n=1 Tax=Kingdonia uniflora TaxID=39325 RepID=A0A7J7LZC1_9MAGN|nr:hypothetical protein GIB67_024171 [Kingdonia uniflora]